MTEVLKLTSPGEAWQLSTYRRLDALNVPAFSEEDLSDLNPERTTRKARLYRLPTALPREIMSFGDWLSSTASPEIRDIAAIDRLSLLFRYLSSPLRYEPNNTYQVHRAVPSARCTFPIDLLFTQTGPDGRSETFLYHPSFHALEAIGESTAESDSFVSGTSTIAGIGRFWKIVKKYGDFTPFPVMLEAGMLIAQLRFLRGALGWKGEDVAPEGHRVFCNGVLEFPIFEETIDEANFKIADLPVRDVTLATQVDPSANMQNFERLSYFADIFDTPSGRVRVNSNKPQQSLAPELLREKRGFLQTIRLRHSANDVSGMVPLISREADLLERFAQLTQIIRHNRQQLPGEELVKVTLLWPGRVGPAAGIYDHDGNLLAAIDGRKLATVLGRSLPSQTIRYNLAAHSVIVLMSADPHAPNMQSKAAFRDAHLAAGALAQDYCLAAAALGQFARPVRMLREHILESVLPIDGRIVYTLLCGRSRATNLTAELL